MGLAILIIILWVVAAFLFLAFIYGASTGGRSYPTEKEKEIEDKEE